MAEQHMYSQRNEEIVEITDENELLEALTIAGLVNRPLKKSMYQDLAQQYQLLLEQIDPLWSKPRAWMMIQGHEKHILVRGYISKNKICKEMSKYE